MPILRRLFDFYLDASIHVSFAILALVHVTCLTLNISVDTHLCWFLFFGSIACYNFVKYGVEAEKYILAADPHQMHIQWASFLALGFALYHGYFLSMQVYIVIAGLVVLTGLYAIPVLPRTKNLRSLGGLKIFVVAMVWAGATVILPVIAAGESISWDVQIETLQRFLLILILLVPFEIRDLAYDSPELRTLPQRFGITGTKIIGACAILPFFLLTLLKDTVSRTELMANGVLCLILGMLIWTTKKNRHRYYASFLVETVPIFWWVLVGL
ncbi:hypothetical protein [Pricia sp.]|uniref:hypothetical protein n=1 Tax=Pricia sp. TaxID=2268138 RepID=UPI003593F053